MTPLHIAAAKGHSDVLEVLLKFGAFPNLMDVTEERCQTSTLLKIAYS